MSERGGAGGHVAGPPGWFGRFGGQYVAETLMPAVGELARAHTEAMADPAFGAELDRLLREYVGRPSPLTFAARLSDAVGCRVYLKREDLNHTGAHKINNCVGQALLARRNGKWQAEGMPWKSRGVPRPRGWRPGDQLKSITGGT